MQSVDFYASSEEGGFEEGGSKPGHKINEFQAAWNVTNAIQVQKLRILLLKVALLLYIFMQTPESV